MLVVGAIEYGSNGPGAAYVFTESASVWTETAKLTASDGAVGDDFGESISINGNTIVAGSHAFLGPTAVGAAYVFAGPPEPDLTVSKSHTGNFKQGDLADTYTITVNNVGSAATTGTVTVTDACPPA